MDSFEAIRYIRRITFSGNSVLSDKRLTESLGLRPGQRFEPRLVSDALPRILNEYKKLGYFFAKVEWEQRPAEKGQIILRLKVAEGGLVKMGQIKLSGNTVFSERQLLDEFDITGKQIFDDIVFQQDIERLMQLYSENGRPLVKLLPVEILTEDGKLNLKIDIDEGPLIKTHQIRIDGLSKTRENILLRELPIRPGDIFDQRKIDESLRRLNNLGYFQSVAESFEAMSANDDAILKISVTEGKTGQFSGILGYNPSDDTIGAQKFTGILEAGETNILGTGRQMLIRAKLGTIDSYEFAYEEPWFFGAPVDLGIRIWGTEQEASEAQNRTDGESENLSLRELAGSLSGTMRMIKAMEGSIAIAYKHLEFPAGSMRFLSQESGSKYSLTFTLQRNSRDFAINPTTGRLDRASVEFSRGDFRTTKVWLDLNQYFKTRQQQVVAIGLHGARVWGEEIPPTEILYLGGANTLRGYSEDFFKGEGILFANCEYRFLVNRDSQFFIFMDCGTFYDKNDGLDELKLGYGVGMRLRSQTGLISVDYGLARGDSILGGKIHVSLGAAF